MVGDTDYTSDTVTRRIGMATSYPNASSEFVLTVAADCYEPPKREASDWTDYLFDIFQGAVVNWVYSRKFNEWRLSVLYWKSRDVLIKRSQVMSRKPMGYHSGFCSRHRGLHWRT